MEIYNRMDGRALLAGSCAIGKCCSVRVGVSRGVQLLLSAFGEVGRKLENHRRLTIKEKHET